MFGLDAIVVIIIISLVAGGLASLLMGQKNSLLGNILLGFCGTIVGDVIITVLNFRAYGLLSEIVVSTIGAIVLIWLWRSLMARPRRRY